VPAVAVDLGGTFLRCAIASDSGQLADLTVERISHDSRDPELVWAWLFDRIAAFAAASHAGLGPEDPIAFAFPGPVADRSRVIGAPTVVGPAPEMPDVAFMLRRRTSRPVYLLNDVSAAAWYYESVVRAERFMVVTVSSGIGSKVVDRVNPERVLDARPYAGEIGHIVVDVRLDAPLCDCGGRGHLGAIASGRGTENMARRMSRLDAGSFNRSLCVTSFGATHDSLTNEKHLVPAALAGDPWSWSIIRAAQQPLAQVLATVIVAASLECVLIIGGFATTLGERYIDSLREAVHALTRGGLIDVSVDDMIVFGPAADEACLRGAGLFARSIARTAR
jgi:predicted NBD/HSP70 family sugar kinase